MIEVKGLKKEFDGLKVLNGIDYTINQGEKIGSVKAGKYADLIVVNGDPAADITAMYHKPVHVIKEGQMIR